MKSAKLKTALPLLLPLLVCYAAGSILPGDIRVVRELLAQNAQLRQEQSDPAELQAEHAALQDSIARQQKQLRILAGGLPDPDAQSDIIAFLSSSARKEGLKIVSLRPGAANAVQDMAHIPVEFTLRGTFASLLNLLYRLENESAGYRSEQLTLRLDKQGASSLLVELKLLAIAREEPP